VGAKPQHRLDKEAAEIGCGVSKSRGSYKLGPDGKTVRRNVLASHWASRPVELLRSPAFRVLSRAAHFALCRIEIELRQHGGHGNGKLIVTTDQFVEYGIHKRMVPAALRELEELGIICIPVRGRGGNAEHGQPHRFLLNYACGAVDALGENNSWRRVQTLAEAKKSRASRGQQRIKIRWPMVAGLPTA
jgi:hypothetical protein